MSFHVGSAVNSFEGDVIKRAESKDSGSAQEELARFQLLKEKLSMRGTDGKVSDPTMAGKNLAQLSEVEEIAIMAYEKLCKYRESSPEASYFYNLTGTQDRYKQAFWVAERLVDQQRSAQALALVGPNPDDVRARFFKGQQEAVEQRTIALRANERGYRAVLEAGTRETGATKARAAIGDAITALFARAP